MKRTPRNMLPKEISDQMPGQMSGRNKSSGFSFASILLIFWGIIIFNYSYQVVEDFVKAMHAGKLEMPITTEKRIK